MTSATTPAAAFSAASDDASGRATEDASADDTAAVNTIADGWPQRMLEAVVAGVIALDGAGSVAAANDSAVAMLGSSVDELVGSPWPDPAWRTVRTDGTPFAFVLRPDAGPTHATAGPGSGPDGTATVMGVHRSDGELRWLSVAATEPDGENGPALVLTLTDVTHQLEVERMKSEFVSIVSHELRTPLTSLRASLTLLGTKAGEDLSDTNQRMVEIAKTNAERLGRLLDDILDIEQVDSGRASLSLQQANSSELVRLSVESMLGLADKAGVELRSVEDSACWLWVDPDRIVQTLTNLISNAVKFSPEGGTVTVSAVHQGNEAVFEVIDEGRGIPSDMIDTIFERFQQVDASDSREKGGTGLGLAICKSIAAQHGGDISVRSTVGQGSVFTLTLPALASLEPTSDPDQSTGPSVLVCDVNPDSNMVLRSLFAEAGCRVLGVETTDEAIALAGEQSLDAVLLDLGPDPESGAEAVGELTAAPAVAEVPLVMVVRRQSSGEGVEFNVRGRSVHPQALVKRIVDLLAQTTAA